LHISLANLSLFRITKYIYTRGQFEYLEAWARTSLDEIIIRYERRSKETTIFPNKPIPTGYNVWGVAQRGFLLCWNWHVPGVKNGPVGVKTPVELGGTKRVGNGGNKTQVVALHLIKRLPEPPQGSLLVSQGVIACN
jgi:hypothetical protein